MNKKWLTYFLDLLDFSPKENLFSLSHSHLLGAEIKRNYLKVPVSIEYTFVINQIELRIIESLSLEPAYGSLYFSFFGLNDFTTPYPTKVYFLENFRIQLELIPIIKLGENLENPQALYDHHQEKILNLKNKMFGESHSVYYYQHTHKGQIK